MAADKRQAPSQDMFTTKHRRGGVALPRLKEGKNGVLFTKPAVRMSQ